MRKKKTKKRVKKRVKRITNRKTRTITKRKAIRRRVRKKALKKRIKKVLKGLKKIFSFPFLLTALVILCSLFLFLFFWQKNISSDPQIYIFQESPAQGDTVLIKVKTRFKEKISGVFNEEEINFFRPNILSDQFGFLAVDGRMEPGQHKVLLNVSGKKIEKEIEVKASKFSVWTMYITQELKDKGYSEGKIAENISKKDGPSLDKILSDFTPEPYFKGFFSFPLDKIEKSGYGFGEFINGQNYQVQHFGVDLKAAPGTKVYAVNEGKVVFRQELANYGKTIVIDHGLNIFSLYLHLEQFKVSLGEMVKKKEVIGLSGNSGYSIAPHLHFSMRVGKARIDPVLFIETSKKIQEKPILANIQKILLEVFKIKE